VKNRLDYIDGADLIANKAIEQIILNGQLRSYGLSYYLKRTKGDLMAGSRTHFKIRTANSGKDSNRVRDNSKWYKSVYDKLHNLAVTTSYDLNKKILGNFVLQSGQLVTYPNGQYTYLGVVVPNGLRNENRLPHTII
jgi:hypothetical protein